ncbi:hypothetical protein MEQU1_001922 [Malassezia equina]|uniref:PQ loop repeat protein n=1 Tax=Malassezia equina TaxID=1381935 RepID=A0AAF0EE29_9BASI|nr:hypothetical protein MEQU1_001922 [Malassezia equina]
MRGDECVLPPHNGAALQLSIVVCIGVVLSYIPQILRIVAAKSSVGLSPWFLFLGTTSSWSATLNLVVLQWPLLRCSFSPLRWISLEHLMGVLQAGLQQTMFTIIFILFMVYYKVDAPARRKRRQTRTKRRVNDATRLHPPVVDSNDSSGSESDLESIHTHIHRSYGAVGSNEAQAHDTLVTHAHQHQHYENIPAAMRGILERHYLPSEDEIHGKVGSVHEKQLAVHLVWMTLVYLLIICTVTATLIVVHAHHRYLQHWAGLLGLAGAGLAACQYVPQIWHTARAGLVRSVSISTMCVQVPGSVVFMYALAGRDGVNWTTLLPYVAAAVLQSLLLALCVMWKIRQHKRGVDDYGRSIRAGALR